MGLSVGFKIAPGLSVRASGRGIRTSAGPRVARVHVGGGSSTLSSGFGPFAASTTSSGNRKNKRPAKRTGSSRSRTVSNAELTLGATVLAFDVLSSAMERRAEKKFTETKQAEQTLLNVHREKFPTATRQIVKPIRSGWRGLWRITAAAQLAAARLQEVEDKDWARLSSHDQYTVIRVVDDAFADNASVSTCIDAGTDGADNFVTLVITYPGSEIAGGYIRDPKSKTLRARSSAEQAAFYKDAIASTVIATVQEAFAVAPSATQARVIVLRNDKRVLRAAKPGAIYAAVFDRVMVERNWKRTNPADVVFTASDLRIDEPALGPLKTLSASQHPDLEEIARQVGAAISG